jgi:hypothetical protein
MISRRVGVDDVDERRLQRSTTDKETVNVGLLGKLAAVLLVDAAAVQDAGLLRSLGRDLLLHPLADGGVDLLSLLGGRDLAGANGPGMCQCRSSFGWCVDSPDGLVGNDDLAPVLNLVGDSLELLGDNVDSGAGLPLLETLTAAQDDADATIERSLGLAGNESVVLLQDGAALRVAKDGPCDTTVLELLGGDLTGEGTVGLVVDVLGGNLEALAEVLAGQEEVEGRRSDDDLCSVSALLLLKLHWMSTHQRWGQAWRR